MDIKESRKIIQDYHNSIKDSRPEELVRSIDVLPCSSARIKYAHFVYGEYLIDNDEITNELLLEIFESYGLIDGLFKDDPEIINNEYAEFLSELKKGLITTFRMPNPFGELAAVMEFVNFMNERSFLRCRQSVFKGILASSVYHFEYEKAINNKDLEMLKKLVNSSLTRVVNFPGKKDNSASVFV